MNAVYAATKLSGLKKQIICTTDFSRLAQMILFLEIWRVISVSNLAENVDSNTGDIQSASSCMHTDNHDAFNLRNYWMITL